MNRKTGIFLGTTSALALTMSIGAALAMPVNPIIESENNDNAGEADTIDLSTNDGALGSVSDGDPDFFLVENAFAGGITTVELFDNFAFGGVDFTITDSNFAGNFGSGSVSNAGPTSAQASFTVPLNGMFGIILTATNAQSFGEGYSLSISTSEVPLPASGALLLGGAAAFAALRRRNKRKEG
ncbi:MAG: VPLPA-CTERM sorting domain-containing protein [Pseudomonadota bacterium]